MKRTIIILILAFTCLGSSYGQTNYDAAWKLEYGPYKVGLKVINEYDYSRTYGQKYDSDENIVRDINPRHIQIAVWYPAKKPGKLLKYKDLLVLDDAMRFFKDIDNELVAARVEKYIKGNGGDDPVKGKLLRGYAESIMHATRDAKAENGNFPLIIYSVREHRGVQLNVALCEYLASHGFIVASTPSKGDAPEYFSTSLTSNLELDNNLDLRYLKAFMHSFPNVNSNKVGVFGHGPYGTFKAIDFALRDNNVSALLSLDGMGRNAAQLNIPAMVLRSNDKIGIGDFQQMKFGDVYLPEFKNLSHLGIGEFFNLAWAKMRNLEGDFTAEDYGYSVACKYTLEFFKAYLKGESQSMTFINGKPGDHGYDDVFVSYEITRGVQPPVATYRFFQLISENKFDIAWEIYNRTKTVAPNYQLFTLQDMDSFLALDNTEEQLTHAYKFALDAYPDNYSFMNQTGQHLFDVDKTAAKPILEKFLSISPRQNDYNVADSLLKLIEPGYKFEPERSLVTKETEHYIGEWHGTLLSPVRGYQLEMKFLKDDNGKFNVTYRVGGPTRDFRTMAVAEINSDRIKINLLVNRRIYEGTFDAKTNQIVGKYDNAWNFYVAKIK